jgi:glycosyltransferase involved in cell wall biosynthesis
MTDGRHLPVIGRDAYVATGFSPRAGLDGCRVISPPAAQRIGYVLKMYPRFSETFILGEVLAHEAAGADLHLISLRLPIDGRFHGSLADVRAPVTYLAHQGTRAADLWELVRRATHWLPRLPGVLDRLAEADASDAAQALELAMLVEDHGLTHLHAHFGSVATTVARLASLLTGVPYTFTAHAKDIFHDDVDAADLRRKLLDAAGCVAVSDFNAAHLRAVYGVAADRVVRIYNGIDLGRFPYAAPHARRPAIVSVGRLVEKKGFDDLIAACAVLAGDGRRFRCDIIGSGPLGPALTEQILASGLDDVVFLNGSMPQHQVREVVQRAAVFAAPCVIGEDGNRDGLPTVLLEALALGTPCVATDVTGVPEVIRHEDTGLLVGQHDPQALARSLGRLLDDRALSVRLAGAGRALVEAEFDAVRQSAQLRALFARSTAAIRELAS